MALTKTIQVDTDVSTVAYKIVSNLKLDNDYVSFDTITYFSATRQDIIINNASYGFVTQDKNDIENQAYIHLKSLPENNGWVDA